MSICPVCSQPVSGLFCPHCGFDMSRNYVQYPTFVPLNDPAKAYYSSVKPSLANSGPLYQEQLDSQTTRHIENEYYDNELQTLTHALEFAPDSAAQDTEPEPKAHNKNKAGLCFAIIAALLVAIVILVSQCKNNAAKEAHVQKNGDVFRIAISTYKWEESDEKIIQEKCTEFGWEYEVFDYDFDHDRQISDFPTIVEQQYDAIIVYRGQLGEPPDDLKSWVQKAIAAGTIVYEIPVIDEGFSTSDECYRVRSDYTELGRLLAEKYVEICGDSGQIAVISSRFNDTIPQDTVDGFLSEMQKHLEIEILSIEYCDYDSLLAQHTVENLLETNSKLDAILLTNPSLIQGIICACESMGRTEDVAIFGIRMHEYVSNGQVLFSGDEDSCMLEPAYAMDTIKAVADGENIPYKLLPTWNIYTGES